MEPPYSCVSHPYLSIFPTSRHRSTSLEQQSQALAAWWKEHERKGQEALSSYPTWPPPSCVTFTSDSTTLGLMFLVCVNSMAMLVLEEYKEALEDAGCSVNVFPPYSTPSPGVLADHLVQGLQTDGSWVHPTRQPSSAHTGLTAA